MHGISPTIDFRGNVWIYKCLRLNDGIFILLKCSWLKPDDCVQVDFKCDIFLVLALSTYSMICYVIRLTVCSHCIMFICKFDYFLFCFRGQYKWGSKGSPSKSHGPVSITEP